MLPVSLHSSSSSPLSQLSQPKWSDVEMYEARSASNASAFGLGSAPSSPGVSPESPRTIVNQCGVGSQSSMLSHLSHQHHHQLPGHGHLQHHHHHQLNSMRMLFKTTPGAGSAPCLPFGASTFSIASSSNSTNSDPDSVSSTSSITTGSSLCGGTCPSSLSTSSLVVGQQSSSSSSLQSGLPQVVVKVHSRVLCAAVEYKTLSITTQTTCKEVVRMLMAKFRMKHRDHNLFYLTMEVWIRKTGIPIRSVMVLDENACPAHLQTCYPHQQTKFTLCMRRGGLVKVYDSCLMSGALYKSLLLSDRTTVDELVQLLLYCYSSPEKPQKYALYEVCPARNCERRLHAEELPLRIQLEWPTQDLVFFQLRKKTSGDLAEPLPPKRRLIPWTRTIDSTGNVTFRLNLKDDNVTTTARDVISSSPSSLNSSYNDYENYVYI